MGTDFEAEFRADGSENLIQETVNGPDVRRPVRMKESPFHREKSQEQLLDLTLERIKCEVIY